MKKKLFIFSNESISVEDEKFYCDNLDLKSTPEGLNRKFEVNLIGRKSNKKRSHEIKLKRIKVFKNIFSNLSEVKSTLSSVLTDKKILNSIEVIVIDDSNNQEIEIYVKSFQDYRDY